MLRSDRLGVTSFIRDLSLRSKCYENLLHFFHSTAYRLSNLRKKWYGIVAGKAPLYMIKGRIVLIGDGVKQSKEARRMPGVKKLSQESETCSKPEYIHGHFFGAVGVLIANGAKKFCLPLKVNLQDGLKEAATWDETKASHMEISSQSHIEQMIEAGFEAAKVLGKSFFLLDRYFLAKSALELVNKLNREAAHPDGNLLEVVTKAKSNCTGYRRPYRKKGTRGRPPKKGNPIKLIKLFNQKRLFQEGKVLVYGKEETVSYYGHKLLWGKGLYQELLFVLVVMGDKRSILVSTDTTLDPLTVIELYALRFGIEGLFREFKQQPGGFSYHFWTLSLPKLNHYAKKTDPDPLSRITDTNDRKKILESVRATEMFVMCASVAMGILQILALDNRWATEIMGSRYLRTRSKNLPSEGTVMYYLRRFIFIILGNSPSSFITKYIREKQMWEDLIEDEPDTSQTA